MGVQQTLKIPPLISTKYFNIEENGYMFWYLLPTRGNYHTIPVSVGIFKEFSILGGRNGVLLCCTSRCLGLIICILACQSVF